MAEDAAALRCGGEGAVSLQRLDAKRPSKSLALVPSFDPSAPRDWCELVRDVVAMANSGGGTIVIARQAAAALSPSASPVPLLTAAVVAERVAEHTGVRFERLRIEPAEMDGHGVIALSVDAAPMPLVFEKAGVCADASGRTVAAFNAGSIYVRHGAKSEPARSAELARLIERQLRRARREWMSAVRKAVGARPGAAAVATGAGVVQSERTDATPIRITADPDAPEYRLVDPDVTHPWRQKELMAELNARLPESDHVNSFDLLAVRRLHDVDGNAQFVHRSKFATTQYAPAFLAWLLEQHASDPEFFRKAREAYKKLRAADA